MSYFTESIKALSKGGTLKVGFLGLGKSNLALIREAAALPYLEIVLRDSSEHPRVPEGLQFARCYFGKNALDSIDEDVIFLSPSARRDIRELKDAASRGVILTSDCELFFNYNSTPVIGVTGSDGKSTVTTLTSLLLEAAGYRASAVGNIGIPLISAPQSDILVCELSSFNLEYVSPALSAAAITNITPNHLNWHASFEEYVRAKMNILTHADRTVLSADDDVCSKIIRENSASAVFSSKYTYGELKRKFQADVYYTLEGGSILRCGERIIDASVLSRREEYNLRNAMCALSLTDGLIPTDAAKGVLRSFRGLEHRCEEFLNVNGVSFINSSIDTTPARTAQTLTALGRHVRIILGGRGKGLSYEPLLPPLCQFADRISVYGEASEEIANILYSIKRRLRAEIGVFKTFDECVAHALHGIADGDTVLLSPACTAYGEFRDFTERGKHFKNMIRSIYKIV